MPPTNLAQAGPRAVGLIGLGLMGRGMGLCLLRAGFSVTVLAHRQRAVVDDLVAAGAREACSPREVASLSDVVVLCLPDQDAVNAVLLGRDSLVHGARAGLHVIECSTLTPDAGQRLHRAAKDHGVCLVDAPLTGGPREAVEARLHALVGGETDADADAVSPVLAAFCQRQHRFPGVGQGYAAKLVNNLLAFANLTAVAEAMTTAAKAGLDIGTLAGAIECSGGQSRCLNGLAPWLSGQGESRSIVTVRTAAKDVNYFCQFAGALGTLGPIASQVSSSLADALAEGLGDALTPRYVQRIAAREGVVLPVGRG